jgi:zinc ribbon protein
MRRWLAVLLVWGALAIPFTVQAQTPIKLSSLQVQLWPEYDQPSMLVIYDFRLPESTKLPVSVSMTFPKEAHLVAVASQASDGSLLNTDYIGPNVTESLQTITIQIQTSTTYHIEYYQPLSRTGKQRQFTYLWPGDYAIDDISISIRVPPDTTSIVTDPIMKSTKGADGSSNLIKDFGGLGAGQEFPLQVSYTKTTDTLSVPAESVQPSKPIGSNTPGRVLLSNYLPYALGALGIAAIAAASIYLLQPHNRYALQKRRSHPPRKETQAKTEIYCHQCGARAEPGDRFCRVCGTRLRLEE